MPDIFMFSETCLNDGNLQNINKFQSFYTLRSTGRSGGVSIYVKNHFKAIPTSELCFANLTLEISTV